MQKTLVLIFGILLFASCGRPPRPGNPLAEKRLEVGDSFYYWESTAESNPGDVMRNLDKFKKLEDKSVNNLRNVLGKGEHYVWVKFDFVIPDYFRGQPLMLVIPHLKFASQLWINGTMVSQSGSFPPNPQSNMFKSLFFSFPVNLMNTEPGAKNTVLIKIYAVGKSGISSHSYMQPPQFAFPGQEIINFHHARVYMFLVGTLVFTFILYMCLFISLPKFKEYRDFALINFFTLFFLLPFFSTEMPFYNSGRIPFVVFTKFTYCIPAFLVISASTHFAFNFMQTRQSRWIKILRTIILVLQIGFTLRIKTYEGIINAAPFLNIGNLIQIGIVFGVILQNFIIGKKRKYAFLFCIGFSPFILAIAIDLIRRAIDHTQTYTFLSLFGWLFAIINFIIVLSVRFARTYANNEQLTNHLQDEVEKQTREIKTANNELSLLNERLEREKLIADMDLQMASIVQQRFFPRPNKHFRGWEISVYYSPQSKVSGDLYDYYNYNEMLNGLSLFDVSGHGISASLVTMLSKSIISHTFQKGYRNKESMEAILSRINNTILFEKGDIENYMTGILCRFGDPTKDNICRVEIGNAGHPYPLLYSAKTNDIIAVRGTEGKKHYGAIGMKGIAVAFGTADFDMEEGDILMCYTDGLTESTDRQLNQYGTESIKHLIEKNHSKSAAALLKIITEDFYNFTENKPVEDDITIIIAKRTNPAVYVPDEEREEEEVLIEPEEELEELPPEL